MDEKQPIEDMTFLQVSRELENIVRSLESGELELEQALTAYSRGVELLGSLKARLADAERKVKELTDAAEIEMVDTSSASSELQ
jgi:exodeoxyribonuclease VII small subunit